ncbi:MAG: DUF2254 domain-containing protein [Solirubrobacterales bacterium]
MTGRAVTKNNPGRARFMRSIQLTRFREWLSSSLAVIPVVFTLLAVGLAAVTLIIDRAADLAFLFSGGEDAARSVLSTVAASMITFTGLVFSITIVALQLASSQFSPRVLSSFLRDRLTKLALGTFVATFTYAFAVLRSVRGTFVPELSVTVAIALVAISLIMFVQYINHIAQQIRVSSIVRDVALETREIIATFLPDERGSREGPRSSPRPQGDLIQEIASPVSGSVYALDKDALVRTATQAGVTLVLLPSMGDFVPRGGVVARVYSGGDDEIDDARVLGALALGAERTLGEDPAFGLRQLVDIAARALSPGINDPTTAVQAIDHIHDLLRDIGGRELPDGVHRDEDGSVRLIAQPVFWTDYLDLGVDEIRLYGEGSVQVARRLRAMLEDLERATDGSRSDAVRAKLSLLASSVVRGLDEPEDRASASAVRGLDEPEDRASASAGDEQGLGS